MQRYDVAAHLNFFSLNEVFYLQPSQQRQRHSFVPNADVMEFSISLMLQAAWQLDSPSMQRMQKPWQLSVSTW